MQLKHPVSLEQGSRSPYTGSFPSTTLAPKPCMCEQLSQVPCLEGNSRRQSVGSTAVRPQKNPFLFRLEEQGVSWQKLVEAGPAAAGKDRGPGAAGVASCCVTRPSDVQCGPGPNWRCLLRGCAPLVNRPVKSRPGQGFSV